MAPEPEGTAPGPNLRGLRAAPRPQASPFGRLARPVLRPATTWRALEGARGSPKPYKFIGFGGIHGPKPYKFIGFGGQQPEREPGGAGSTPDPGGNHKFTGFGDIHGPKPYKFIGFGGIHGPRP